ncbi:phage tail protein [Nocardioides sp.]|uniref:phage tail protein n=1 Tax=Nocardioides sp. TaxID=35761 RepID=UPI0035ADBEC3
MTDYYPPWGFYYRVDFPFSRDANDARFQTVSGLSVEYDTEEYKEGGENRFTHKLPGRTKYGELVLKRGMLVGSQVISWFTDAFRDRDFRPSDVAVILMNEEGQPLRTWKVAHAVPKKWTVSDLNASENSVVVETIELSYRYFTVS